MGEKYTTQEVIKAIRGTFGIKTAAAKALQCSRNTIDNYIERHPTVASAYQEERARLVDMAESKFAEEISKGEWPAIRFALATLGRDRGFVESKELIVDSQSELNIILTWDDDNAEPDASEAP